MICNIEQDWLYYAALKDQWTVKHGYWIKKLLETNKLLKNVKNLMK